MTITRIINGKKIDIELTWTEKYNTYCEYQHECDKEDVISYIEENEIELSDEEIDAAAWKSRKYQDNNDCISECLWVCVEDAIKYVKG